MNKNIVLKQIQNIAKAHDLDLTLSDVNELIKIFDETYATLGEQLEVGKSVNVGAVVVKKKQTKERTGKNTLSENGDMWHVPAKEKIVLGTKKSFEKEHEKEI